MAKFKAPDLSNATLEFLVDEMAKMSMIENYAKKMRNFYKEAYFAKAGIDTEFIPEDFQEVSNLGEMFTANTTASFPNRIDQTKLKEDYPEVAAAVTKSKGQLTTRFSLNEGVNNPIIGDLIDTLKAELDLD